MARIIIRASMSIAPPVRQSCTILQGILEKRLRERIRQELTATRRRHEDAVRYSPRTGPNDLPGTRVEDMT
jgi:hypothetical protein